MESRRFSPDITKAVQTEKEAELKELEEWEVKIKDVKQVYNFEALTSLGEDFNVCWDAWQQNQDVSDFPETLLDEKKENFDQEKFLKAVEKLKPVYLEYIKNILAKDMSAIEKEQEADPKIQGDKRLAELGKIYLEIIELFSRLEHEPDKILIGGKTQDQLIQELEQNNIDIHRHVRQMINNEEEFITQDNPGSISLVRLKVKDLFPDNQTHTFQQILDKALKLGLALCPAEVGPYYRLAYTPQGQLKKEQPLDEYLFIVMKSITVRGSGYNVFRLDRDQYGASLGSRWAGPKDGWIAESGLVLCLRK